MDALLKHLTVVFCALGLCPIAAQAESAWALTGGMTTITQQASDPRIDREATVSLDLELTLSRGRDAIGLFLEGNSTPAGNGVSTLLGEANADAGTALDDERRGRVQLSGLAYRFGLSDARGLSLGLLDPSAFMDHSLTSNDENLQFLGASFVNNLTIEFPDYSLGLAYEHPLPRPWPGLTLILASSHGLADNANASYVQLLNVDDPDKGVFVACEAHWTDAAALGAIGLWTHTAPHDSLDGNKTNQRNYGLYATFGRAGRKHAFDLRLGLANAEVYLAEAFAAVTLQYQLGRVMAGFGAGHTWLSHEIDDPNRDGMTQIEAYTRLPLSKDATLTPSVQYLVNSGFDASGERYATRLLILGMRLNVPL